MGLLAAVVDVFAIIAQIFLLILGMFLILVVLLQRGRGGGLAGAFGGAGGQSAFGTKAGDVFTRITIGIAILWVITNGVSGMLIRASQSAISRTQLPSDDTDEAGVVSQGEGEEDVLFAPDDNGSADEAAGSGDASTVEGAEGTGGDAGEGEADATETGEPEGTDSATVPMSGETGSAASDGTASEEAPGTEGEAAEEPTEPTDPASGTPAAESAEGAPETGEEPANPPN